MPKKPDYLKVEQHLAKNKGNWVNRILIAVPSTGLVRMEWVLSRYGQVVPTNWSHVEFIQWLNNYVPMEYLLPDAENLIAKQVVERDFEWLFMIESDNLIPPNTFIKLNEYMLEKKVPIVSGLYFTKSEPPEPILYRGRGTGYFKDFKIGDKVWVDGIPFGCVLIHGDIIKTLWAESPEYKVGNEITRRVFEMPDKQWGKGDEIGSMRGTTDLAFYSRIIKDKIFEKSGWGEYQNKKYPFLVDTSILVEHIDQQGRKYPLGGIPLRYKK
jgi:hypothetical protein